MKIVLMFAAFFLLPTLNFGQVLSLGSIGSFVMYTSNGSVSNSGSSSLTGNIGTDVGSISGFGTAIVMGSFYNANAVTAQAKTDLFIVYNQLISIPATVTSHAPVFGGSETLVTGIYTIAGAGSLAGSVTLDGLGDTSAVFIFRFAGAFAVGASSSVILTNGARACNVFWAAEGAISVAASTIMKGTFIANNAAVSIGANCIVEGRMLSTTGAVSLGSSIAYLPNCVNNVSIPTPSPCCHPNFGSTIDFVLFTNNGAVSNTGASNLTRNIGSDIGSISGFGTATVMGSFYNADAITAQAKIDLFNLYNQLSITPTTNTSHTASFGLGETLYTGVYYIGSAASLAGPLILDAQGDTNAVFIFKIRGAFAVGANSTISLLNSASACSVFWVSEGAISIGATSIIKGTFIANNAAVSMGANGDLKGRLFSTTGAISFNQSNASNIDPCHLPTYPLPIELLSFTGSCKDKNVMLKWSTATEINNNYYTIERSINGTTWQILNKLIGAGSSTTLKNYTYTDVEPYNEISYYRLKQTNYNETFNYSKIIDLNSCANDQTEVVIYPNPASRTVNLSFKGDKTKIISVSIYNILGELVYYSAGIEPVITLDEKLSGIYLLCLNLMSRNIIEKFVIAK